MVCGISVIMPRAPTLAGWKRYDTDMYVRKRIESCGSQAFSRKILGHYSPNSHSATQFRIKQPHANMWLKTLRSILQETLQVNVPYVFSLTNIDIKTKSLDQIFMCVQNPKQRVSLPELESLIQHIRA